MIPFDAPPTVDTTPDRPGRRVRGRTVLVALLVLAGVVTGLYPTASAWMHQREQSKLLVDVVDQINQAAPEGMAEEIRKAYEYNGLLTGGASVGSYSNVPQAESDQSVSQDDYRELLRASTTGIMARVRIPVIDVDLPVYHGTSDAVLLQGVGHLQGTALPVGGPNTHSVLTAHRGLATAEMFTNLDQVQIGDTFTIEVFGEVLTYRVHQVQVVDPDQTEKLYPIQGRDLVTLVTCTPLGINTQRILVTAERITPTPAADLAAAGQVPNVPGFPWWAVILGVTVVLLAWYVVHMSRPRLQRERSVRWRPVVGSGTN